MQQHPELRQSIQRLVEVAEYYGFQGNKEKAVESTLKRWITFTKNKEAVHWMKILKYKTAAFFSAITKNPIPEKPFDEDDDPSAILAGGAYVFIKKFLHDNRGQELDQRKRVASLLASMKQAKKGMPRPSKQDLDKALKETLKALTDQQPPEQKRIHWFKQWADIEEHDPIEYALHPFTIREQLRRTVDELFEDFELTDEEKMAAVFPSTSANYINNRKKGGAVGYLLKSEILQDLRRPGGYLPKIKRVEKEEEIKEKDTVPEYNVDYEPLKEKFNELWRRMMKSTRENESDAQVRLVALAEALKVRIISAGPPLQQTVLKTLWKKIHTILRKHSTFTLIGKPQNEEILQDLLGGSLKENESFLSGDFKSATDKLYSWVSDCIAERISERGNFDQEFTEVFVRSLTKHMIEIPDEIFEEMEGIDEGTKIFLRQTIGQLMGSITSFPILCIANAAGGRWAIEIAEGQKRTLKQCRMAINGDDVAIKSKSTIYKIWSKIMGAFGLEESVGKTYLSREFVEINSTTFLYRQEPKEIQANDPRNPGKKFNKKINFEMVNYVNLGLLLGIKRSGKQSDLSDQSNDYNSLASRARKVMDLAPPEMKETIYKDFIKHNFKLMNDSRLPWYIPEWLGGLGLPTDDLHQPSDIDLRIAHKILLNWKSRRPKGIRGKQEWRIRKVAEEKLNIDTAYSTVKSEGTEAYETLLQLQTINLLFDSNISIRSLLEKTKETEVIKAISYNAKLWRLHGGEKLPPALELDDITFQAQYPVINLNLFSRSEKTEYFKTQSHEIKEIVPLYKERQRLRELRGALD